MNHHYLCDAILKSDAFMNENNIVDKAKFNHDRRYDQYCHVKNGAKKCETNEDYISAITTYLFLELGAHKNNDNGKYFLMWLGDKLFSIVKEKDEKKANSITLNDAYDQYLKNRVGNFDYWKLLFYSNWMKNANLRHIHELYRLLKYICNTIADYRANGASSKKLPQNSTYCINQYRSLYKSISGCDSYLHLLDKLKYIYENFRTNALNENRQKKNNLKNRLQILTTIGGQNSYFAKDFKEFDFNAPGCVKLNPQGAKQPQTPSKQGEKKENLEIPLSQSLSVLQLLSQSLSQSLSQLLSQSLPLPPSQPSQQSEPTNPSIEDSSENNEQTDESQEPSINSILISNDHETETDNPEIDVKEIISEIGYSGNMFNEYKTIVFSVIAIAVPIILAVIYKYLAPELRKKFKRKQSMKKVINLCDEQKAKKEFTNTFIEKNQSE
ncbi:CIR protein [Plasmodium chabaudi chabaudi]|uniref:CIR protein n=1 Tax=Plasmodium chabaudi chabaudi TaxID=31271 RepID=A0A1C6WJT1_PLACU|nr:CIR protein [Plasmodium chabaudi chabaudi]